MQRRIIYALTVCTYILIHISERGLIEYEQAYENNTIKKFFLYGIKLEKVMKVRGEEY